MAVDLLPWLLGLLAVIFALVSGANDGGVLVAMGIRYPILPLSWFIAILLAALVAGPLVLGVAVARTLAQGLLPSMGAISRWAFLIGVAVALLVVSALSRVGLPTSLTLALVGGIAGSGAGFGLTVSWSAVARVLLVGVAAPAVGVLAGFGLDRIARRLPSWQRTGIAVRRMHLFAFIAQCVAYASNDGQKMLAVAAVAGAAMPAPVALLGGDGNVWLMIAVLVVTALLFGIGMTITLRRVSGRIGLDLVPVRPVDAVSAELASAGAVFGSSLVGAPVSMTQTVTAALVGVAGSKGLRRVRWSAVVQIATAWMVTLPSSVVGAFVVARLARGAG